MNENEELFELEKRYYNIDERIEQKKEGAK